MFLSDESLAEIQKLLRNWNKLDFTAYKAETIRRRIIRRIQMINCKSAEEYLDFVAENQSELEALFNDLLIEVTSFYRDPEAFQILEDKAIEDIVNRNKKGVRAWVSACATGQEAYSLAISFYDKFVQKNMDPDFRVFATDISEESVGFASAGIYSAEMLEGISEDKVKKIFLRYRRKAISHSSKDSLEDNIYQA